jgi:hypothetical protein
MHFMPEDEGYQEKLWPDAYKAVITGEFRSVVATELRTADVLRHAYDAGARSEAGGQETTGQFPDFGRSADLGKFADFDRFADRITDMLVAGAEKGADEAFDDIVNAFLYESPLPAPRVYAAYLLLPSLPESIRRPLMGQIVQEYSEDEVFVHAYNVGYCELYPDFESFMDEVAASVALGVLNGADDMLTAIYRSFATGGPLPPARRNAKRVKNWYVPKGSKPRDAPLKRRTGAGAAPQGVATAAAASAPVAGGSPAARTAYAAGAAPGDIDKDS